MALVITSEYFIITVILNTLGVLSSAFIVAFNLWNWAKGRKLNTCDLIFLALGTSCTCLQCTVLIDCCFPLIWNNGDVMEHGTPVIFQFQIWAGSCTFWFTTGLCVFYCVKIVDFSHPISSWLKLRISKIVPWLLLGKTVGSGVISIPVYWYSYRESPQPPTANVTASAPVMYGVLRLNQSYDVVVTLLGFLLPALFCITTISLILISLKRHTRRMKEKIGFSQPRLEAHFGAAKVVGSLLLLCTLCSVAHLFTLFTTRSLLLFILWFIIVSTTPTQSIILILGNTKLKHALWKALTLWRK
ncbi:taste receptor type 2 member 9-like [Ambystoma mexicanum]|uniref:taste receptor type 2 member 9-like n=1 Tax=Ambystoma mexicanum TaxID=8296 RepID=UPI0037E72E44